MKSKSFLQLIIFSFFIAASSIANAAAVPAETAEKWSSEKGRELINALAESNIVEKYNKLDNLFLNYIDLEHIGQFVMGKNWRTMTPKQRKIYIPLFKRYSLALYKGFPLNFNKEDVDFVITRAAVEKTYTLVTVNITLKAKEEKGSEKSSEDMNILVEFRLHQKNGQIMLTDLKIAETSFILTYRNRFNEMIARNDGDIEWFLEDLELITASTEKNNEIAAAAALQSQN